MNRKKNTSEYLRSLGIQPSAQRIAIYEYLDEHHNHPTVDMVYQALMPVHPTLSRTTVYNTMKSFAAHNAVQTVLIEDGELRFDCDMSVHGHFKCRCCGDVSDVFMPLEQTAFDLAPGFSAEETHIYFRGVCPACRKN